MKSARGLRPDRFIEIMEMARSFGKAESTLGDHTRANLVDLSDDENDKDGQQR
jgi:hypothetical protein